MGLLMIQDHGEKKMIRLAFGPESVVHSAVFKARKDLGLASNSLSTLLSASSSPSPFRPLSRQNSSALQPNLPSPLSIPNTIGTPSPELLRFFLGAERRGNVRLVPCSVACEEPCAEQVTDDVGEEAASTATCFSRRSDQRLLLGGLGAPLALQMRMDWARFWESMMVEEIERGTGRKWRQGRRREVGEMGGGGWGSTASAITLAEAVARITLEEDS
ncbi:hypothetical protein Vadar_031506 [Vaccinium darrowii]|uniref:Uncharacterized protein n=1 Tax=Vaccinium darrowii TaxID=229202 RepID=A0ACB7XE20_9ERIC|nr:hypothetical protein Vadar_031506 [Vaccinium darrowii]